MTIKKKYYLVLMVCMILAAMTLVLGGCADDTDPDGEEANVIRFGAPISLTGAYSGEGASFKNGYELYRDHVNDVLGGIQVGDEMYKVEFIFYDDTSNTDVATRLVEKLITEDNVDFVFGPYGSTLTFATSAITERYQKIMVAPASSAPNVYSRGYNYLFGVIQPPAAYSPSYDEVMSRLDPKPQTIAFLSPDASFPLSTAEADRNGFEAMGYETVAFETYPPESLDFSQVISKLKSLNPDVVRTTCYVEDSIMLIRQAVELDFNPKLWIFSGAPNNKSFTDELGKYAEDAVAYVNWSQELGFNGNVFGSAAELGRIFEERFGYVPLYYDTAPIGAAIVLQHAIEKAGTLDTDAVRDALASFTVDNPIETEFGWMGFDETGLNYALKAAVLQVQNGEPVLIGPEDFAKAQPRYPAVPWRDR